MVVMSTRSHSSFSGRSAGSAIAAVSGSTVLMGPSVYGAVLAQPAVRPTASSTHVNMRAVLTLWAPRRFSRVVALAMPSRATVWY